MVEGHFWVQQEHYPGEGDGGESDGTHQRHGQNAKCRACGIAPYRECGWGAQSPSGKVPKGGGIPPMPPLVGGAKGVDGKARDRGYKRLDGWRTRFVSSRCFKMEDVVLPEDFPYELRLIIAPEYRKATVEMRNQAGWWMVHQEMRIYPAAPNRRRSSSIHGEVCSVRWKSELSGCLPFWWTKGWDGSERTPNTAPRGWGTGKVEACRGVNVSSLWARVYYCPVVTSHNNKFLPNDETKFTICSVSPMSRRAWCEPKG